MTFHLSWCTTKQPTLLCGYAIGLKQRDPQTHCRLQMTILTALIEFVKTDGLGQNTPEPPKALRTWAVFSS